MFFFQAPGNKYADVVNYFLGLRVQQALRNLARGLCKLLIFQDGAKGGVI